MLQRSVWTQLARLGGCRGTSRFSKRRRRVEMKTHDSVSFPGPIKKLKDQMAETLEILPPEEKHWFTGGKRSAAIALNILRKNEIIAVPTDTIYGLAGLAQSNESIEKIYALKGRDKAKPLAITLSSVTEIDDWAEIDHVPPRLLFELLPGPVTVVLKRKEQLNRALNPGHESVGIRVPRSTFIRQVCKLIGEPLALTSANFSNEPSTLHPDEFSPLWPHLGAIFYNIPKKNNADDARRLGSTVVDLTVPGKFKIIREGSRYSQDVSILRQYLMPLELGENEDSLVDDKIAARESQ